MKKVLKKALSMILSIVMIATLTVGIDFSAYAETVWTYMSFEPGTPYEIMENTDGWEDESGVFYYYLPNFGDGDTVILSDESGNSVRYTFDSDMYCFMAENGDSISADDVQFINEQEGAWTIDGDNYLVVVYNDLRTTVPVTITENPVRSFTFNPVNPLEIIERTHGWERDDGSWVYSEIYFNQGDTIVVNYSDGTSDTFVNQYSGWGSCSFENENNEEIAVSYDSFSFEGTGNTEVRIHLSDYNNVSVNVPVTIIESPADYCEFVPVKPYENIVNTNGYFVGENEFHYWAPEFNTGDAVKVYMKDGTTETYIYEDFCFQNENGNSLSYSADDFTFTGTGETTFLFYVNNYGKTINVPITIIESPVRSFTFNPVNPLEIVERTHGYESDNGLWEYNEIYFNQGDTIVVNYSDGTSDTFVNQYSGWCSCSFENENNEEIAVSYDSFAFEGTGNTEVRISLSDYNVSVNVPVSIIQDPIDYCELVSVKPYEIVEKTHGYYDSDGFWWYWSPNFNEGDKILIHKTDNSTETYTYKYGSFMNEENVCLNISGEQFQHEGTGEIEVKFYLWDLQKEITVPVTITENPADYCEFIPAKPYENIVNTHGYFNQENEFVYRAPDFNNGDTVKIYMKDGTTETYIYEDFCFQNENGNSLSYSVDDFTFTGTGETTFVFNVNDYGKSVNVPITIVENPVDYCELISVKPYEVVEKTHGSYYGENEWYYWAPNFNDGDKIIVHFNDGSIDTFTFTDNHMVNESGEELSISYEGFAFEGTGETTFGIIVEDYGKSINAPVTIIENPIESISATPAKNKALVSENYSIPLFDLTIQYKDGTSKTFYDVYNNVKIDDGFDYAHVSVNFKNDLKLGTNEFVVEYLNKTTTSTIEVVDITLVSFKITQVKPVDNEEIWNIDKGSYECTVTYSDGTVSKYDLFILYSGGLNQTSGLIVGDYAHEFSVVHDDYDGHKISEGCSLTFSLRNSGLEDSSIIINNKQFEHKHTPVIDEAVPATCKETGLTEGSHCSECGEILVEQKVVQNLPHGKLNKVERNRVEPTCTKSGGYEVAYICTLCGDAVMGDYIVLDPIPHNTKTTTTKATASVDGKIVKTCTVCKKVVSTTVIPKVSSIKLEVTSLTYNGKVRTPKVIVKDRTGKTISSSNYTVTYASGRKNVGKYAVKITFKGNYSGTKTLYFTIVPKTTSISSLTSGSKKFTVKWKKQATQTTGYQIQYSTSSKFSKAKTVTVGKNTTVSKTISKLTGKKKYYVRVRTYKTVGSTKYYSNWSTAKAVTTKG